MTSSLTTQRSTTELPYAGAHEHLAEELARLDARIRVLLARSRPDGQSVPLRGLALTEGEIAALLSAREATPAEIERGELEALERADRGIEQRLRASAEHAIGLPLPLLAERFGLSPFEEQCLVACLAPEVDGKYERIYAYIQDDLSRRHPTVDLLFALMCRSLESRVAARAAFDPRAPLRTHRLLRLLDPQPNEPRPLMGCALKLDERIAAMLVGDNRIDARLASASRLVDPLSICGDAPAEHAERMACFVGRLLERAEPGPGVVFHLKGRDGSGREALAAVAARQLDLPLLVVDLERTNGAAPAWEEFLDLCAREAFLQPAVLCLRGFDRLIEVAGEHAAALDALFETLARYTRIAFIAGGRTWWPRRNFRSTRFLPLELDELDTAERARAWSSHAAFFALDERIDLGALAGKFRFTSGQLREALESAETRALWSGSADRISEADLYRACRDRSTRDLAGLARKLTPRFDWKDIVLPDDQLGHLRELCDQVRLRHRVMGEWGFDRRLALGKGVAAMFSGPSGTGKTMAAEVVARELGMDLFKVDLSQVVSKYIGETEKNLDRIFTAAEDGNAVLFFDEADALFGKRSEVRDSHDRYANVEVSYLLQKMEEYQGVSILATNLRQHMDEAFLRRLQAIVEFPFPDVDLRERIWRVSFPSQAPLAEDLDLSRMAREVRLTGGNIKNIALAGAYFAAQEGESIRTDHLLRATHREFQKLGRGWAEGGRG